MKLEKFKLKFTHLQLNYLLRDFTALVPSTLKYELVVCGQEETAGGCGAVRFCGPAGKATFTDLKKM